MTKPLRAPRRPRTNPAQRVLPLTPEMATAAANIRPPPPPPGDLTKIALAMRKTPQ
jgi:hypothetical protein